MTTPKNCYTCANSPKWYGIGTPAGCSALTGDEDTDRPVVDFCEASGCNDEASERYGWPYDGDGHDCPMHEGR